MSLLIALSLLVLPSATASSASWFDVVGVAKGIRQVGVQSLESQLIPASSSCQLSVLEKLGWKITRPHGSGRVIAAGGNPCDHGSLEEARAQGSLMLEVPAGIEEVALQAALRGVLGSHPSVCAYKFPVAAATARATWALARNSEFGFVSSWPFMEFARSEFWRSGCSPSGGKGCYSPRSSIREALEEFSHGKVSTDCALGLQAAEYSSLRELYGDKEIDVEFRPGEIVFAPWNLITETKSVTWGDLTSSDSYTDSDASMTSELGAMAFSGMSGYVGNVYGEAYLDSLVDRGENFETLSVSLPAAMELRKRGGFADFNRLNVRIFELGRVLNPRLESLALTTKNADDLRTTPEKREAFRELQSILANPVYAEYKVFVHPLGVKTLGEHLVRLLRVNPRTPYSFELYPSRTNRGLFTRYVNRLLSNCR